MQLKKLSKILNYDKKKKLINQDFKLKNIDFDVKENFLFKPDQPKMTNYLIVMTLASFLFLLLSIGIFFFIKAVGIDRTLSPEKIDIVTQAPSSVNSGEAVPMSVRIVNRNPKSIENVTLIVNYPNGSYNTNGERLTKEEVAVGRVESGGVKVRNITPTFFGTDGQEVSLKYDLEYRLQESSQLTTISDEYSFLIRKTSVSISKPVYSNAVAGKEFSFSTTLSSNQTKNIDTAFVKITYPVGFTITSSIPSITTSSSTSGLWKVNNLAPGQKVNIKVNGFIRSGGQDEQSIIAEAFISPNGRFEDASNVARESSILKIGSSFVSLDLLLNGSSDQEVVASNGEEIRGEIRWKNVDSDKLNNLKIVAKLDGFGLDQTSVNVVDGYFDEVRKEIVWDNVTASELKSVNVSDSGRFSFRFRTVSDRPEFAIQNNTINIKLDAEANRLVKNNQREIVKDVQVRDVKLRSLFEVASNVLYATGKLKNFGPIPPLVDSETTYSIQLILRNQGNRLTNLAIEIPLDRNVNITGETSGLEKREFRYDEPSHSVYLTIPIISAIGADSVRVVEFQVIVSPKERDLGTVLQLTNEGSYEVRETFVGEVYKGSIQKFYTNSLSEISASGSGTVGR